MIGGVEYNADGMAAFLGYGGPDASTRLAHHLTANKLNLARGSHPYILPVVVAADAFLVVHPPGTRPTGAAQAEASNLKDQIDLYNNTGCQVP